MISGLLCPVTGSLGVTWFVRRKQTILNFAVRLFAKRRPARNADGLVDFNGHCVW